MASAAHSSEQAQDIRLMVDAIPTLAWSARSDGSADFFNQSWLDYTGLSAEQAGAWERAGGPPAPFRWRVSLVSFPCDSVVRQRWTRRQMVRNQHRHRRSKTRGRLARRRESRSGNDRQGQFAGIHS